MSPILSIVSDETERASADRLATLMGHSFSHIVVGDSTDAARYIQQQGIEPKYIMLSLGARKEGVLEELNELALQCQAGTEVIVVGQTNDIQFYRALIDCGVLEYFTAPVEMSDVAKSFSGKAAINASQRKCPVIAFCSAASGDGSSSVSVNTAYALATEHKVKTVLVDMDYQYGMIAKNLDLSSQYGLKELFDHPDRGIDTTLVERMTVSYAPNLDVIAAPNLLQFYPQIQPELIHDLIRALQQKYDYIILDLPHLWSPWIAAAFNFSDTVMLVAQLWLKSVTHASRQIYAWREAGVDMNNMHIVLNRSGAKFKEGVSAKDFERVCQKQILSYLPNDIRTIVEAENQGKTIHEIGKSKLAEEVRSLAAFLQTTHSGSENTKKR